jgi:hypothetical protein
LPRYKSSCMCVRKNDKKQIGRKPTVNKGKTKRLIGQKQLQKGIFLILRDYCVILRSTRKWGKKWHQRKKKIIRQRCSSQFRTHIIKKHA